jgi:hypothetical protein
VDDSTSGFECQRKMGTAITLKRSYFKMVEQKLACRLQLKPDVIKKSNLSGIDEVGDYKRVTTPCFGDDNF